MRVGITGHQKRDGIEWGWVRSQIDLVVTGLPRPLIGYTSLAVGADQVFASSLLEQGATLTAVIPIPNYEAFFNGEGLDLYRSLLNKADQVQLPGNGGDDQEAFFKAGLYVAKHSDLVIAVWDEQEAKGHGGTADVVRYCEDQRIPLIIINPIERSVSSAPYDAATANGLPKKQ
ncbi:hypothetical protein GFL92_01075 [Rhizobium leguminosarum bv. viciae]|nr:hypothetical protein [Rhizobium leguminosarum bv. viciae]